MSSDTLLEELEVSVKTDIKYESLLSISKWMGILSMAVDWGIFVSWTVIYSAFNEKNRLLMSLGNKWLAIGMFLCVTAIVLLVVFVFINKGKHTRKAYGVLGIIMLNIPSVFFIVALVISCIHH